MRTGGQGARFAFDNHSSLTGVGGLPKAVMAAGSEEENGGSQQQDRQHKLESGKKIFHKRYLV